MDYTRVYQNYKFKVPSYTAMAVGLELTLHETGGVCGSPAWVMITAMIQTTLICTYSLLFTAARLTNAILSWKS